MDFEFYKQHLKNKLSPKRFEHCTNVANCAAELAKIYGENEEKASVAGLLHDVTKELSDDEHIEILKDSDISFENFPPKLFHGISGSKYVKQKLGIADESIRTAIRYHTTGRENMSMLEKIVFVADYVSPERKWLDAKELYELAKSDIDKVALCKLLMAVYNCLKRGQIVHFDTLAACKQIIYQKRDELNSEFFRKIK